MLQIAQASVNDPRRPARRSRGKIMLLDQKRPFTAPGTLARNSDAVNSATDHNDLKPLTLQRRPSFRIDGGIDRKSTRLNSSHLVISYAVFCLKKKKLYEHSFCVSLPDALR